MYVGSGLLDIIKREQEQHFMIKEPSINGETARGKETTRKTKT
jgi:hypothetical protein